MDINQYNRIYQFLLHQTLPSDLTDNKQTTKFKNFCKPFIVKHNYLYRKDKRKPNNLLRVIRTFEMEAVLYMMHNSPTAGHFSTDIMFEKIRSRYYWPQMYENIREYVKSCDACQRRGKPKTQQQLHPIAVHAPFYQIGIDFVGPLPRTQNGNRYIIVAMDYLTKWPEARPVPVSTAEETEKFIYEDIICQHGCPRIILTDRGAHFNNQLIQGLSERFKIKHLFSTPYHPQTNGLVERFNRTLCESLAKLVEHSDEWDKYVKPVLFAYRTSKQSTTKITPFYLTYGREAVFPVDDSPQLEETLSERITKLLNVLPSDREEARLRIDL
jgi:Integrase zinc binding domain/Integrase core domain